MGRKALYLAGVLAIVGCNEDGASSFMEQADPEPAAQEPGTPPSVDCAPDKSTWDNEIKAHVEQLCAECHGSTPQFGAASTLNDYARLLEGSEGTRWVDQLADRLSDGTMPPAAQDQPDATQRKAIIDWATCGESDAPLQPNPGGIGSDQPILDAPDEAPAGTDFFDLRAPEFHVEQDWDNRYECFTFEVPTTETRYIKRIETLIDDSRVLHHTVLIPGGGREAGEHGPCRNDNPLNLIYGWAPGQGALHFDEGGMLLQPGTKLTLQVHYNNRARHADVRDKSGVRIYHGPVEGPEINMLAFGPVDFEIPANQMSEAVGYCRMPQDTRIVASFPHMHEVGSGFEQVVIRDGDEADQAESIITLDGWNFEAQYIYETPVDLKTGDLVRTTCRFRNETDQMVRAGANTEDEMCFNFAYVTPPLPNNFCNSGAPAEPVPLYAPGECAPEDADAVNVPQVGARILIGEPEPPAGGTLNDGTWTLLNGRLYLPSTELGPITVDLEQSTITAQGLLRIEDGTIIMDAQLALHLVTSLTDFDQTVPISLGANWSIDAEDDTRIALDLTCGESDLVQDVRFSMRGERLILHIAVSLGPASLAADLEFDPVE